MLANVIGKLLPAGVFVLTIAACAQSAGASGDAAPPPSAVDAGPTFGSAALLAEAVGCQGFQDHTGGAPYIADIGGCNAMDAGYTTGPGTVITFANRTDEDSWIAEWRSGHWPAAAVSGNLWVVEVDAANTTFQGNLAAKFHGQVEPR